MANVVVPLAIGVGANLLSRVLNPSQRTVQRNRVEAQRLEDLKAPDANFGYPIRELFGRYRVDSCSLIWGLDLREEITTTTESAVQTQTGGKGGGPGATTTITETETARYYMTAAFLIGGEIEEVTKVWANGILIYEVGNTSENSLNGEFGTKARIYTGSATQLADPAIVDAEGVDNVPALRGMSYIVFDDYPIELFRGSTYPRIDVEVKGKELVDERVPVGNVIHYMAREAGISEARILFNSPEAWLGTVWIYGGAFENSGQSVADFIEDLSVMHNLEHYEENNNIYFYVKQTPSNVIRIPFVDLGARSFNEQPTDLYSIISEDKESLPSSVRIDFLSVSKQYARNNVFFQDPATGHINEKRISTGMVASEEDMMRVATRLVYQSKNEGFSLDNAFLPPSYAGLKPGDCFYVGGVNVARVFRVIEKTIADDYRIQIKAVGTDAVVTNPGEEPTVPVIIDSSVVTPPVVIVDGNPPALGIIGTAELIPLDINMIRDNDPEGVVYIALIGDENWTNGTVYLSRDGGATYQPIGSQANSSIVGFASGLPNLSSGADLFQPSQSFTVTSVNRQISSVTQTQFDNNQGLLCLVGDEFVMARDAVLIAPGEYEISYLKRGVRGTEWAIGGHTSGEQFVLLSAQLIKAQMRVEDLANEIRFKAVGLYGNEPTVTDYYSIPSLIGCSVTPYSAVDLQAVKDQAGNILISWTRRDRRAGFAVDYSAIPMSEAFEAYEIQITGGRLLESNTPTVFYSAANQIDDFGSVQSSLTVSIWQMSAVVGRGYVATASLTPVLAATIPVIEGFSPTQGEIGVGISIFGFGFTGATEAAIAGELIDDFLVVDDNTITGTVSEDTITGKVSVTNVAGTGFSITDFVVVDATTVDWGQIGGEIRDQLDLQDRFNRIRRYTTITANATIPSVGGTVNVTLTDPDGFAPTVPVCLFRMSTVGGAGGYAQLLCIGRTGDTLTLERDATGLVTETEFLAGDIIAPIIDREVNIYGGLSIINQITNKLKNVESISTAKALTLSSEYFQFLTPTASSVIVQLPAVTGSDYFEGEIINAGDGTNELVVQESDSTPIITLSLAQVIRSIYYYWDGSIWRIFERNVYG